ncbi:transketolase family protein [Frankia sp. Cr1]|uniref:transketolase family protein n=1 Tax=Frankia sp. Cr1 TaxID=3073931 RepID=UPI002AD28DEE|nr:transketolase C-terminal domain-containing protein [Frankia sp. Cr1]
MSRPDDREERYPMTVPLDPTSWNIATSDGQLDAFVMGEELADLADDRPEIVLLTADLMTSNRTGDFARRHPHRHFDLGIAEQNMMGVAAGMAACGFRPYVSTFASFASLLCAEHLRTDLAYPRMPVRVLAHHAGIAMGFYGTSHHAVEDIALTRAIAHLTVVAPCDANATRAILRGTLDQDGPVYIRLGRGREKPVYDVVPALAPGRFATVREGTDATMIATGLGVQISLAAAHLLAADGIDVGVLDAVYLKPFDEEAVVAAAEQTGHLLTVEEHNVVGGLGAAVGDVLARHGLAPAFAVHGLPDDYALVAPPTHLYRHYGLDPTTVAARMRELLKR